MHNYDTGAPLEANLGSSEVRYGALNRHKGPKWRPSARQVDVQAIHGEQLRVRLETSKIIDFSAVAEGVGHSEGKSSMIFKTMLLAREIAPQARPPLRKA